MGRNRIIYLFCLSILISTLSFPITKVKNSFPITEVKNSLTECLQKLISNENRKFTQNIRISLNPESKNFYWNFGERVTTFLATNLKNVTYELGNNSHIQTAYTIHTRMLFVDSSKSFEELVTRQRNHAHDSTGIHQYYYVILLMDSSKTNNVSYELQNMISFCLKVHIINVNILVEDNEEGIITIYSYYPFTQKHCRDTTPIVYNRYYNGAFEMEVPSFPRKIQNFWKCPLKVVVWNEALFMKIHRNRLSGIDGNLLEVLSEHMNFSLNTINSPNGRGEVFENGSSNGAFKLIHDEVGDMMLGGSVSSTLRTRHLSCSTGYLQNYLSVVLKRPRVYRGLQILIFPFDTPTWLLLLVFLVGKLILSKIANQISIKFGRNTRRICILVWLLSILIIRSSYEGSIFKYLNNQPRVRLPQSFKETLDGGYKFLCRLENFECIKRLTNVSNNLIPLNVSPSKLYAELQKCNGKFAILIPGNTLFLYANDHEKLKQLYTIKKPIVYSTVCIYMPKFSYLSEELNSRIEKLVNHGIIQLFYDRSIDKKFKQNQNRHSHPFSIKKLMGAFQLLFLLIGVSLSVFVLEILSLRIYSVKKILDFIHGI